MGGLAYNTIASLGRQAGEIIGIKGGDGWMREKFGLGQGAGSFGQFGAAWRKGGLIGVGRQAKHFFGFGYMQRAGGMALDPTLQQAVPYLQTMGGTRAAARLGLIEGSAGRALKSTPGQMRGYVRELRGMMGEAQGVFRRRRIAGGVGLAVGAVAAGNTIGFGNLAVMGAGVGGGAVLGGAIGRAVSETGGGAVGRRVGGKLGLGIAGLGLITGVL